MRREKKGKYCVNFESDKGEKYRAIQSDTIKSLI